MFAVMYEHAITLYAVGEERKEGVKRNEGENMQ
jgi:hypothetical protein